MRRRPRPPAPTPVAWVLLAALIVLLAGLCVAVNLARAQEVDPAERYTPSARSGRQAVVELAEAHFPPESVDWAVRTARCESGYDPYAYSAGFDRRWGVFYEHVGALQVDGVSWRRVARELALGDFLDPDVNVAVAAWILERLGPGQWPWCGR